MARLHHRFPSVLAYAALVVAFAFGQWRFAAYTAEAREHDQYVACVRGNDVREVARFLVESASQSGLDLTTVNGYDALDPAMKRFLINLREASNSNPNRLRDLTFPKLLIRDCAAEYPSQASP